MIDDFIWDDELMLLDDSEVMGTAEGDGYCTTAKPKPQSNSHLIAVASCLWQRVVLNVRLSTSINASYTPIAIQAALAALKLVLPSKLELRFLCVLVRLYSMAGLDTSRYIRRALHLIERRVGLDCGDAEQCMLYLIYFCGNFIKDGGDNKKDDDVGDPSIKRRLQSLTVNGCNPIFSRYFIALRDRINGLNSCSDVFTTSSTSTEKTPQPTETVVDNIFNLKNAIQEGGIDDCEREIIVLKRRITTLTSPIHLYSCFFLEYNTFITVHHTLLSIYQAKLTNKPYKPSLFSTNSAAVIPNMLCEYSKTIAEIRKGHSNAEERIQSLRNVVPKSDVLKLYRNIILTIEMLKSPTFRGDEIASMSSSSMDIVMKGQIVDLRLKMAFFLLESKLNWRFDKAEALLLLEEAWNCSGSDSFSGVDDYSLSSFIRKKIVSLLCQIGRPETEIQRWL